MTTPTLRARVIAMAMETTDDHNTRRDPRDLALAVAALVAEECARECDKIADARPFVPTARDCAAAIRKRAEGLHGSR